MDQTRLDFTGHERGAEAHLTKIDKADTACEILLAGQGFEAWRLLTVDEARDLRDWLNELLKEVQS